MKITVTEKTIINSIANFASYELEDIVAVEGEMTAESEGKILMVSQSYK